MRRDNGLIEPFPRSIGIRNDRERRAQNEFKEMVDISDIPGGKIGNSCQPEFVVFLSSPISDPPDYKSSPEMERLKESSGLIELQRHLLNGRAPSRLSQEFSNSQSRIMMELAGIFGRTSFYRLTIGRLKNMADIVEGIVT